ncbi:MAG: MFS transporter [Bordetella sp.]|nr:MAG: MFS transporter [Bordetella sp.]
MGLQGFIVTHSLPKFRGRNITTVIAGLYAGHLSGAAVGSLLVEQLGFRAIFIIGAIMLFIPLGSVLIFMKPYMHKIKCRHYEYKPLNKIEISLKSSLFLLKSKNFSLVLFMSIIPFSIAQVGFLSFALPLYLESEGAVSSTNIGRILMLYGLCVIYFGPLMGRLADRTTNKKYWIVLGGVIGSSGILGLYFIHGITAAAMAVFFLAVASCCIGSSVLPYMLAIPRVEKYGIASVTGFLRASDKLGQMVGPLFVGVMFSITNIKIGLAFTGALYFGTTIIFLLFASNKEN